VKEASPYNVQGRHLAARAYATRRDGSPRNEENGGARIGGSTINPGASVQGLAQLSNGQWRSRTRARVLQSERVNSMIIRTTATGAAIDTEDLDVLGDKSVRRLCDVLGPEIEAPRQVMVGVERYVHWLRSGVVLLSETEYGPLVMMYVCFDAGAVIPYPRLRREGPNFTGEVVFGSYRVGPGESESALRRIPNLEGFGGGLTWRVPGRPFGEHARLPLPGERREWFEVVRAKRFSAETLYKLSPDSPDRTGDESFYAPEPYAILSGRAQPRCGGSP
jgi:hypothetical protein